MATRTLLRLRRLRRTALESLIVSVLAPARVKRALTVYYGQPYGQARSFAGNPNAKLKGGFMAKVVDPLAAAVLPGMR